MTSDHTGHPVMKRARIYSLESHITTPPLEPFRRAIINVAIAAQISFVKVYVGHSARDPINKARYSEDNLTLYAEGCAWSLFIPFI